MGDKRRFEVTRDFILRNYPRAYSILCVADGQGDLARLLQDAGKNAQVIDPVYNRAYFDRRWKSKCDLIVGLHPDEATAEIVLAGEKLKIPYLIVPCCVKGMEAEILRRRLGKHVPFDMWIKHLHKLSNSSLRQTQLRIKGANLIMYK